MNRGREQSGTSVLEQQGQGVSQTGEEMMERWNVGVADMRSDEIPCAPRETERESEERRREDGEGLRCLRDV